MVKLTCNIDRAGRWARGISGLLSLCIAAIVLCRGAGVGGEVVRWTVGVVAFVLGVFQIFEALTGWCITRALGFRTPM
jgi:uncharacterized membrane protein HdeD (DUF308 family)